ncbi:MAG: cupin domain-containing protein [Zhongshania sp.]|uniref:cupin domain-containing protein n=1 Tax=Zhongshania sp. TaxID=1971902 RepID=UPI002607ED4E|nr:cupin domain-containing protein [Zhongshania sp.]MDF1691268.1 cupin domain-containing protein [Zhongshania sp.]
MNKHVNLQCLAVYTLLAIAPPALSQSAITQSTVIDLSDLRANTASYEWFDFKHGLKKLILSGTPDSQHVSILWYWYEDKMGTVPLHYHAKTESIYVIDGSQTDDKGDYPKGSFYFNPPSSGHDIRNSRGLFLLSYAAPPDFKHTDAIQEYNNTIIDADYSKLPFATCGKLSNCYKVPLNKDGGMSSIFASLSGDEQWHTQANALLLLSGSCSVDNQSVASDTLIVAKATAPIPYIVSAAKDASCIAFSLSF